MASSKISALTLSSALAGSEMFPSALGGANFRVTTNQIRDYVWASPTLSGTLTLPNGTLGAPSLVFANSATSGLYGSSGSIAVAVGGVRVGWFDTAGFQVLNNSGYIGIGAASDTMLYRDAAAVLALRNGVSAQTFRVYNTYTDASNYERARLAWSGNALYIGTEAAGTGTVRNVVLSAASNLYFGGSGSYQWQVSTAGHLAPLADATYDFGTASLQIRDAYLSRYLKIGGAAPAGAANMASIQSFGQNWSLIGSDVLTDVTTKVTRFGVAHYTNAEEPFSLIGGQSDSIRNQVWIGGGAGSVNAATDISFYTAANNTALSGTLRWQINTNGMMLPFTDNVYDLGGSGNRVRQVYAAYAKFGLGVASNTSRLMVNTPSGTAAGIQLFQDGNESWIIENTASASGLAFTASGSTRFTLSNAGVQTAYNNSLFSSDNTYDFGAAAASRARSGYYGTNVVIGYSTTSTAQLHVGAGAVQILRNGIGADFTPMVQHSVASGVAGLAVGVQNGANNPRAALFVDDTNSFWGLVGRASSTALPFIIQNAAATHFQLSTAGVATLYNNLLNGTDNTYDLGAAGANRFRTGYFGTSLIIGASSTPSGVSTANPRVFGVGTNWTVIGASSVTDATIKNSVFATAHYTNTEKPLVVICGNSTATTGAVYIGGGVSGGNAATNIYFVTAANSTTLVGTERWTISSSGMFQPFIDATYDIGASGAQIRDAYLSRYLKIGGAAPAGTAARAAGIQAFGTTWTMIGASTLTDVTTKYSVVGLSHYDNSEEPLTGLYMAVSGSVGNVNIGGGLGSGNAATDIYLWTSANTTTTTGTIRWAVGSSGHFLPGADATYDAGGSSAQIRDLFLSRYLKIGGAAPAGAAGLATIQAFGNGFALIGADVLTDTTNKIMRLAVAHYTNTEEPVLAFTMTSASATSTLNIGGSSAAGNAVTDIIFYTAANNTTTTGTGRWGILSNGTLYPVADATYDAGSASARIRAVYGVTGDFSGNMTIGASSKLAWSGRAEIYSTSSAAIRFSNAGASSGATLELQEMAAPSAPATNFVRIYAEDNGAGKTRLMALFPTGAAQQIAIEA